ncbi:DUF6556 family protein [Streptococcus halichoeri]|uniref:DUF6556 family protein n=1 Tax=Streptococcus halichoeri TaxID=254785 RepID=UPI000DB0096B|nr:DUF6556 family protein [Streptococcus halichoeri]PZO96253.1 MAG: hypothetical protein DI617_01465 [Streptococcus pyogenes]
MSNQYSRQSKNPNNDPSKHIKTGFTALQKMIALIGGILSIIVATITISKNLHPSDDTKKTDNGTSSSTVVHIIEKDTKDTTNHDNATTPSSTAQETPQTSSTQASSTSPSTQSSPSTNSSSVPETSNATDISQPTQ